MSSSQERWIQIGSSQRFQESRWREAMLYFIFGIAGQKKDVTGKPEIDFFDLVTLKLDHIRGFTLEGSHYEETDASDHILLEVGERGHWDVDYLGQTMWALLQFVKGPNLFFLLEFEDGRSLTIAKKKRRGELAVSTSEGPTMSALLDDRTLADKVDSKLCKKS